MKSLPIASLALVLALSGCANSPTLYDEAVSDLWEDLSTKNQSTVCDVFKRDEKWSVKMLVNVGLGMDREISIKKTNEEKYKNAAAKLLRRKCG
jgi:hypothetical protein